MVEVPERWTIAQPSLVGKLASPAKLNIVIDTLFGIASGILALPHLYLRFGTHKNKTPEKDENDLNN
ncbi:MAG: hypothetical protein IPL32_00005 [Chloracidobacterium sp.]|nr:hypothetical protein [Chloracidobacterium sp.]